MTENIELTAQELAENELLNDAIVCIAAVCARVRLCLTSCIRWR